MGNYADEYRSSRLTHMKERLMVLRHGRDRLRQELSKAEVAIRALEQQKATLEEQMMSDTLLHQ